MSTEDEIGLLKEYLEFSKTNAEVKTEARKTQMQMYIALFLPTIVLVISHTQGYLGTIGNYVLAAMAGYLVALVREVRSSSWEVSIISQYLDQDSIRKRINDLNA